MVSGSVDCACLYKSIIVPFCRSMAMVLEEMAVMRMRCELPLNARGLLRLRAAPPAPVARDNHVLRYRRDAEVLLTHS